MGVDIKKAQQSPTTTKNDQNQQPNKNFSMTAILFYVVAVVLAMVPLSIMLVDGGGVGRTNAMAAGSMSYVQNYFANGNNSHKRRQASSTSPIQSSLESFVNQTTSIRQDKNKQRQQQYLQKDNKKINTNTTTTASMQQRPQPPRLLYIITSGGEARFTRDYPDRFRNKVLPIIVGSVQSVQKNNFCEVDVYLIVSYVLDQDLELELRQALRPYGAGLEIWDDATPYGVSCQFNKPEECMTQKAGERRKYGPKSENRIQLGGAQLARQHRYVIKDKLPYYDFFLAFEDDMLIQQSHVQQHIKWMKYIRELQSQEVTPKTGKSKDWRDPLSEEQLIRFRPGFIRVEVLQPGHRSLENSLTFPMDGEGVTFDPTHCCVTDHINNDKTKESVELMIWETTLLGQTVRSLEALPKDDIRSKYDQGKTTWISLLAIQPHWFAPAAVWPGELMTPKPKAKPMEYSGAKNLAQSAGWMASAREIIQLDQTLCKGGFVPPLQKNIYPDDGFDGNNVEFWSGGIQMWSKKCSIQRFIPLDEFDRHLLYHSSNNKQDRITKARQILVKNMVNDLHYVKQQAEERMDWRIE